MKSITNSSTPKMLSLVAIMIIMAVQTQGYYETPAPPLAEAFPPPPEILAPLPEAYAPVGEAPPPLPEAFPPPVQTGGLSPFYYTASCPNLRAIVQTEVQLAIDNEKRMGASLLRLHFHDCFVQGCDASVLLDDTAAALGEKTAFPNNNSIRGFEVIDAIKMKVEQQCPGVVSCADILTIAARDSVSYLGGPNWPVLLGRRDSLSANWSLANQNLPAPSSNVTQLISSFAAQNLSSTDMVALSGGHTIGFATCITFRPHIYNDTNIDPSFAIQRKMTCPMSGGDANLAPLDVTTQNTFDNSFYTNLFHLKGLLHSDQELLNLRFTQSLSQTYSTNQVSFFKDFVIAMIKMGNISPLTGDQGQVRTNCRKIN